MLSTISNSPLIKHIDLKHYLLVFFVTGSKCHIPDLANISEHMSAVSNTQWPLLHNFLISDATMYEW